MFKKTLLLSVVALSISACGTILSGTSQNISVNSIQGGQEISGAACVIDNGIQKYNVNKKGTYYQL